MKEVKSPNGVVSLAKECSDELSSERINQRSEQDLQDRAGDTVCRGICPPMLIQANVDLLRFLSLSIYESVP